MRVVLACLAIPFAALALPGRTMAHDIYMREDLYTCCHDHDCRPAEPGEIVEEANGTYLVVPSGERFSSAEVKPSPDGRYHRCLTDKSNIRSRTRCILVPAGS